MAEKFTVTYNGNKNTGGSPPVDFNEYSRGEPVTVLGNTGNLVKNRYRFIGWSKTPDGSGILNFITADNRAFLTADSKTFRVEA